LAQWRAFQSAGYLGYGAPDGKPVEAVGDIRPTAIEVTQVIQDLQDRVALIAGKRTFARVHVVSDKPVDEGILRGVPVENAARLYGSRQDGGPLEPPSVPPIRAPSQITPTPDRCNIDHGFLFELPAPGSGPATSP
jgi:hypothetical protein